MSVPPFSLAVATLAALACAAGLPAQEPHAGTGKGEGEGKVKVFILAGQSNMEGKGFPEPLAYQVTQEQYRDRYRHFITAGDFAAFTAKLTASRAKNPRHPEYAWSVRDDVWVNFLRKHGKLTVGYGVPAKGFGPEYNFGHVVGDHFREQVLIIKTAWGGKSLGQDFLPPSAQHPTAAELAQMAAAQNARIERDNERNRKRQAERHPDRPFTPRPSVLAADVGARYGHYYRAMLEDVRSTLRDLDRRFPDYHGQGWEIAGFVWFQGWNDQFNESWSKNYDAHLAHLIRDVRRDLATPKLPVVIGVVGFDGKRSAAKNEDGSPTPRAWIKRGQAAMAARAEFAGTVAVVRTEDYWDMEADAIYRGEGSWRKDPAKWQRFGNDRPDHYYGSPWFFAQVGTAFGRAMVELLD